MKSCSRPYQVLGVNGKTEVPFQAEQFQIKATLTPAPGGSLKTKALKTLDLTLLPPDPTAKNPALSPRRFRLEHVFDGAPDSKGPNEFKGPWFVDIVISGQTGPLKDAERRLIRRHWKLVPTQRSAWPASWSCQTSPRIPLQPR